MPTLDHIGVNGVGFPVGPTGQSISIVERSVAMTIEMVLLAKYWPGQTLHGMSTLVIAVFHTARKYLPSAKSKISVRERFTFATLFLRNVTVRVEVFGVGIYFRIPVHSVDVLINN